MEGGIRGREGEGEVRPSMLELTRTAKDNDANSRALDLKAKRQSQRDPTWERKVCLDFSKVEVQFTPVKQTNVKRRKAGGSSHDSAAVHVTIVTSSESTQTSVDKHRRAHK